MKDIVERLREAKRVAPGWKSYEPNPLCQEAADEIEKLRAQLAEADTKSKEEKHERHSDS